MLLGACRMSASRTKATNRTCPSPGRLDADGQRPRLREHDQPRQAVGQRRDAEAVDLGRLVAAQRRLTKVKTSSRPEAPCGASISGPVQPRGALRHTIVTFRAARLPG